MKYSRSLRPTNENDILAFGREFNVRIPDDYRDFLLAQNGGKPDDICYFNVPGYCVPKAEIDTFYGILDDKTGRAGNSLNVANQDLMYRLPKGFIAIGDNCCGDQILLATLNSGTSGVFFFDHENEPYDSDVGWEEFGNIYKVANSFSDFLRLLK
jgi:hypothetical protein